MPRLPAAFNAAMKRRRAAIRVKGGNVDGSQAAKKNLRARAGLTSVDHSRRASPPAITLQLAEVVVIAPRFRAILTAIQPS